MGKVLHQRAVGTEGATQGSGRGTELLELELKKLLESALSLRVGFLGGRVWSQELHLMVPVGPIQLGIFYDSMILWLFWTREGKLYCFRE